MENIADIENGLNMLRQPDSCNCSTDMESSFDVYAQYELYQVDHNNWLQDITIQYNTIFVY